MADPNLVDFSGRVKRIRRSHARGRGFEAAGTVGGKPFNRHRRRRTPIVGPVLIVLVAGIGLKGIFYAQAGPDTYMARVEKMSQGSALDKIGAVLMRPDPVSLYIAGEVRPYLR